MRARYLLLLCALTANAAELHPQTVQAWNAYVQTEIASMQQRLRPGAPFLWIDEQPDRAERVRAGEVLVSPRGPHTPKKAPLGLIHDWIGAVFIPHATIGEVLAVVRDYSDYKLFYKPSVIDSKTVQSSDAEDRFSMRLMNKSLFLRTALESQYEADYYQVDAHRYYSVARTTCVHEIEHYGEPDARMLPEGEGSGLIWRLSSITRFEQRDGGVYVELEAIALSRNIPASVRWVVDPIVRRVSREALKTSLEETRAAVESATALSARNSPQWIRAN